MDLITLRRSSPRGYEASALRPCAGSPEQMTGLSPRAKQVVCHGNTEAPLVAKAVVAPRRAESDEACCQRAAAAARRGPASVS